MYFLSIIITLFKETYFFFTFLQFTGWIPWHKKKKKKN